MPTSEHNLLARQNPYFVITCSYRHGISKRVSNWSLASALEASQWPY